MPLPEQTILREVNRYRVNLLAYVWLLTSSTEVAEECFLELRRIAVKRRGELSDEKAIPTWCRRVARFEVLARFGYTGQNPFPLSTVTLELIDSAWRDYPNESVPCGVRVLGAWAEKLLPSARRIVALRYGQKLDCKWVARILNRKPSTVYAMLARVHRRLSQHIRPGGPKRESLHA